MSCEKGNVTRKRPQKHQNRTVFKNDLHDTNIRTKRINQIQIAHVCNKCKAVLEWKIKYKKYKVLKSPKSCNKCGERTVKQPYHTVCQSCAGKFSICPKCCSNITKNVENTEENDVCTDKTDGRLEDSDSRSHQDDDSNDEVSFSDSEDECTRSMSKLILAK